MFEFGCLPTLVKMQIVRYAADALSGKKKLKLWSLSHEWQELVLPNMFRTLRLVETLNSHKSMIDTNGFWSGEILRLNRLHGVRHVRKVVITILTLKGFRRLCCDFSSLFDGDTDSWIRVHTLKIYIMTDLKFGLRVEGHFNDNYEFLQYSAIGLAGAMIRRIPSVQNLHLSTDTYDTCAALFCSRLGNGYSNQLRRLLSLSQFTFDQRKTFPCLTCLDVRLNNSAARLLPVVNTSLVQSVRLNNASRKFSWDSFAVTGQQTICFDNLESATIEFIPRANTRAESKHPDKIPQIILPKLDNITIIDCPPDHRIFDNCVLPRQLKTVVVFNSFEVIEHLSQVSILGSADKIYVSISASVPENRLYPVLNQCFGAATACRDSQLHINFETHLNFAALDLSILKTFGISLLHFADLLGIIAYIPGLVKIVIDTLDFDDEMPNGQIFDFEEYLKTPARPLNSNLQVLKIRRLEGQLTDVALDFIQHLVVCLEMLILFQSSENVNAYFRSFVLEYKDEYPHIANITIGNPEDVDSENNE